MKLIVAIDVGNVTPEKCVAGVYVKAKEGTKRKTVFRAVPSKLMEKVNKGRQIAIADDWLKVDPQDKTYRKFEFRGVEE